MAVGSLTNLYPLFATQGDLYIFTCKFDTNTTSAPDGVEPSTDGFTVAYNGAGGSFTVTFDEDKKPQDVLFATADILGDEAALRARVVSYTLSTGVLLLQLFTEDGTSGVHADSATSLNDKTVQVFALCTRSDTGIG